MKRPINRGGILTKSIWIPNQPTLRLTIMASFNSKLGQWKSWDDKTDDTESEDDERENSEEDDENESDDDSTGSEDTENEGEDDEPEEKTIVDYINDIMDDNLTGKMDDDREAIKDAFYKYLIYGTGITTTKFYKQFLKVFKQEKRALKRQFSEDGVEKDDNTVDEAAYNAAFDELTPRLDDIIQELYHQNEIDEKDEQSSLHS